MHSDFIPAADNELVAYVTTMQAYVNPSVPALYGITSGTATAFQSAANDFVSAQALVNDDLTKTPITIAAKDTKKDAVKALIRFINVKAQALPATESDLMGAGFPIRSTENTPVESIATVPNLDLVTETAGQIMVRYRDSDQILSRQKPNGVTCAQIWIRTTAPGSSTPTAWTLFATQTKPAVVQDFSDYPNATHVEMKARWQLRRGAVGPFSSSITCAVSI